MYKNKRIIVVMPAYNAAKTIEVTHDEVLAQEIVDEIIVVDDSSSDETVAIANELPCTLVQAHSQNLGYGGNQKTCYRLSLERSADIVVMIHPDYQYTPKLIPAMVSMIANDVYDCVLASRIIGGSALKEGMPVWKYLANRFLTAIQNFLMAAKVSEYHTGYRAFSKELLDRLDLERNSDDFIFDNQMLTQIHLAGFRIGEVSCPAKYFPDASSINFPGCVKYGLGCLWNGIAYRLAKWRLIRVDFT